MEPSFVFPIVTVGHVDHGKSTIVGHLLAKLGSLPDGKVERIKKLCEKQNRPFEYAFILDALREEQKQGITIDTARIFFKTEKRSYQLLDAPGHVEFVKNMVTGASKAEAALLIVDAVEGVKENSRRHAYLLSFLGIQQVAVLINKMDSVQYSEERFHEIKLELEAFLKTQNIQAKYFIPVSGLLGDNLLDPSENMKWWKGPTVAQALDSFVEPQNKSSLPLRTFVQDVYKFESSGADRRIIAGYISSGSLKAGDKVTIWPSKEKSTVLSLESLSDDKPSAFSSRDNASFILKDALFVTRGNLITADKDVSQVTTGRVWKTDLFWLGKQSLQLGRTYILRHGSLKSLAVVEKIERVLNTSDLSAQETLNEVKTNQAAEVILSTTENLAVDLSPEQQELTRFVLIDNYEISGGGKIVAAATTASEKASWKIHKDLSTSKGLNSSYKPHSLLIQLEDKKALEELAPLLMEAYQKLSIPVLTLSLEELNIYDLPAIQNRVEGAHLAGAVNLVFTTDHKDESLRALASSFVDFNAVTLAQKSQSLHSFPADLKFSENFLVAIQEILNYLKSKKFIK